MGRRLGLVATVWSYCIGFYEARGSLKYKYDASDSKWIDVDSIIPTMTMTYQPSSNLYALDSNDVECLA